MVTPATAPVWHWSVTRFSEWRALEVLRAHEEESRQAIRAN
jgi:hypothetical protein